MAEEAMENRRTTFPIGIQGPGATKLRAVVQKKLAELGVHTDDVLAEYVVVLVGHGKQYAQTAEDLEAFLADDTAAFMDWLWEHLSTHKDLYLSTEDENGGEGEFRAKEGEDVERESPSSPDDSDSAEEPLHLEDQQNKPQGGNGQKAEKPYSGNDKGGEPDSTNVDEDLDGPVHKERQGRGRREDMAAEKVEEGFIRQGRDDHRFGQRSDEIDRRGGRERHSRMSSRDTEEQRSRGDRSDMATYNLTRVRNNERADDVRHREEREVGGGGERRRYELSHDSEFADRSSRGRPHDVGSRGFRGNEEIVRRAGGRFRSDERRGDKYMNSGGRNFLDRFEGEGSWRHRVRNEMYRGVERQHRLSRRDAESTRMDVEDEVELNLPGPPPLRPPNVDGQAIDGGGHVEAVDRIRVELVTDKMGVKRRRQREDGDRVDSSAGNNMDEEPVAPRPPRLGPTARLLQSAVREAMGPPSAPPPPPHPALKRLRPSVAVAEDTDMREAIGRVVTAAESREVNGIAEPQLPLQTHTQTQTRTQIRTPAPAPAQTQTQTQTQTRSQTRSVFGRLGTSTGGVAPGVSRGVTMRGSFDGRRGGELRPQDSRMTSLNAAHYEDKDVLTGIRVDRWGHRAVNGGQGVVGEKEGEGEEPWSGRAMTIGERIKARLAALAVGDGDRVRQGHGAGRRQGGGAVGAGMGGGAGPAVAVAVAADKPSAASEGAAVVGGDEESVEDMKKRMREMQLEVMKLKAKKAGGETKPATGVGGAIPVAVAVAVAAVAPMVPPPDQPSVFVTNVHFAATSAGLGAHFGGCGEVGQVILVKVPGTGAPSGSAYVTFLSEEAAEAAVAMNGSSFAARSLKVVRHHPSSAPDAPFSSKLRGTSTRGGSSYVRGGAGYPPTRPAPLQKKLQWTRSTTQSALGPTSASPLLLGGESAAEGIAPAPEPLVKDASLPKLMSWTRPGGNPSQVKPLIAGQRRSLSYTRPLSNTAGEGAEGVGREGVEGVEV